MSSNVSKLRARLEAQTKKNGVSTPESFANRQKSFKRKEFQAIKNARKAATAYNLTYRALQLQNKAAVLAKKERDEEIEKKKDAKAMQKEYNMTLRSFKVSTAGTRKVLDEYAPKPDDNTAFAMVELSDALEKHDSTEINKAILVNFFEDHDPERIPEVEDILKEWKGREEELFSYLTNVYIDTASTGGDTIADEIAQSAYTNYQSTLDKEKEKIINDSNDLTERAKNMILTSDGVPVSVGPNIGGEGGFIVNAVNRQDMWAVNVTDSEEKEILKKTLQNRGFLEVDISKVLAEQSDIM